MKNKLSLVLVVLCLLFSISNVQAQFWEKIKKKAEDAVLNKTERKIDEVLNKKSKKKDKTEPKNDEDTSDNDITENETKDEESSSEKTTVSAKLYRNFKFIPGETIIFYDQQAFEEVGEFPSKWDLIKGGTEIATLDGEKIILPTTTEYEGNVITPLMSNSDYLGDEFTIEFDIYIDDIAKYDKQRFAIFFSGSAEQIRQHTTGFTPDIKFEINQDGLEGEAYKNIKNAYDSFSLESIVKSEIELKAWHHISISYYKKKLKVYFDERRIANLPNFPREIEGFSIVLHQPKDQDENNIEIKNSPLNVGVKNIRIAHGGGQMYKRILSEGKYVTNGILFDSGKASIQPQSMGVINKIVSVMKEKKDWNFEIIGHTDSDGDDADNLALSKKRAEAVRDAIVAKGIDEKRLMVTGKGEAQPLNSNSNTLEKANNRRVEFIKK